MATIQTERERQQNAKFMNVYMGIVFGLIASYYFGYVGSIMGYQHKELISALLYALEEIMSLNMIYPEINSKAILGILLGVVAGAFAWFAFYLDYERNKHYKKEEESGTGGFMDNKDIKEWEEEKVDPEPESTEEPSPNMIYSEHFKQSINDRKTMLNNNLLVIGGAGTGKSRFVIKPNVLQMNASFVITDPSGEIISALGDTLRNHGYKIKIFNISDMAHSNCYNPLEYIRDEAGVSMVIDCFINNTTGEGNKGDEFFTNAEKLLYSACLFYLKDFCNDASRKNFSTVLNMVNASSVDENNPNAKSNLDKLFDELPKSSLAWKNYKAFKQAAGKTLKSIIISCVTRLRPFMTPQVANLTKRDTLELDKIGDEKTALFIITPQADRTYSFLASMLYSQLFETLYFKGEQQKANGGSERLKYHVRCLMDEFANIGEIPEFPSKLSTMRKYNISATIVLQDKAQIEAMYEKDWRTLVANCDHILYLGSSEVDTLKYMSEKLGKTTITTRSRGASTGKMSSSSKNFQQKERDVMTPEEVGRLPNEQCIVFTRGQRPVLDKKYDYGSHPRYTLTADHNEELAFFYNKMAIYETTKPININTLLKAQSEAARVVKNNIVTPPLRAENLPGTKDVLADANKMKPDPDTHRMLFVECVSKCTNAIAVEPQDNLCIGVVEGVSLDDAQKVLNPVQTNYNGQAVMLFVRPTTDKNAVMHGYILKNFKKNLENSLKLVRENHWMQNYDENGSVIHITVKQNDFDDFKQCMIENYITPEQVESNPSEKPTKSENSSEGNNSTNTGEARDVQPEQEYQEEER